MSERRAGVGAFLLGLGVGAVVGMFFSGKRDADPRPEPASARDELRARLATARSRRREAARLRDGPAGEGDPLE
ncbi:MAG TPA: hypothetical protein VFK78_09960 [Gemmatimonadales bacterium]|nr:hypothetical protein [Gemmatimonadales bacterium]